MAPSHVGAVVAANRRRRGAAVDTKCRRAMRESCDARVMNRLERREPPAPMSNDEAASFIQPYGYAALGPSQWQDNVAQKDWPQVTLSLLGHKEIEDHTFYEIECRLNR